jgi:hypothetical protein
MLNAQDHFKRLADKFEALVLEVGISNNDPERRLELFQRMKVLTDEMDGLILTSLSRDAKQARLTNPKLSPPMHQLHRE